MSWSLILCLWLLCIWFIFVLLLTLKYSKKRQGIRGGSWAISCRCQWVKSFTSHMYCTFILRKSSPTSVSWSTSPSGANIVWTINLCLLFSFGSYSNGCNITITTQEHLKNRQTTCTQNHSYSLVFSLNKRTNSVHWEKNGQTMCKSKFYSKLLKLVRRKMPHLFQM